MDGSDVSNGVIRMVAAPWVLLAGCFISKFGLNGIFGSEMFVAKLYHIYVQITKLLCVRLFELFSYFIHILKTP